VTARGEAVLAVEPDEALVSVTLTALEPDPGTALADVARRSELLVARLDEFGVAKTDRATSGITVGEDFDHTPEGRRSLGHRAIAQHSVRLTDPELIGRLIMAATDELAARIDGPRWRVAADNPARLEVARQAAAQARRKAQAYADGVDGKLGRLLRLTESDFGMVEQMSEAGFAATRGGQTVMPIQPGEYQIRAVIDITIALETS
jgi:uncharacterized protein YggE